MGMKLCFYTNKISPHQMPMARQIVKSIGVDSFRYIYTEPLSQERLKNGWSEVGDAWLVPAFEREDGCVDLLEACDVLFTEHRDVALLQKRAIKKALTIYGNERWFKPIEVSFLKLRFGLPGIVRLLHPAYLMMALGFYRAFRDNPNMYLFPYGVHAVRDFVRMIGLFAGDWRCIWRTPGLVFEKRPGGRVSLSEHDSKHDARFYGLDKMRMWGYSVAPGCPDDVESNTHNMRRLLWVGRMLKCKRVDAIISAVRGLPNFSLTLVGHGPDEAHLRKISRKMENVKFLDFVPIEKVREVMREHDVYVLLSDAGDGWGAVVNEALEEHVAVLGTFEAGASATLLPEDHLFHAGDWRTLRKLLLKPVKRLGIGLWSADSLANELLEFCHAH